MGKLWQELQMNYPVHLGAAVLVLTALWLLARPRYRTKAAIWAAVGLIGLALFGSTVYLIEAALRLYPSSTAYAGVAIIRTAFLGLIVAAILVDRERGADRV